MPRRRSTARGIYKPHAGERPLWDFPDGLYRREVAAHELSAALGWDVVPLTILREDMPHGIGSLQQFVDADFEQHYFTLLDDEATHPQLRRMAVFDIVSNNTDRKGGHCLVDADGHIWGIDNGLSFHAEFKLRTVIWDFAGEPVAPELLADLERLVDEGLPDRVAVAARRLRARRRAHPGPGRAPRGRAALRRDRPPLPLAARLSAAQSPSSSPL